MAKTKKKNNNNTSHLRYRDNLLKELKAQYPYYSFKSNLLGGFFLFGIILTIWEIHIYRVTFISVYIPLSIWIVTGVIMTPIFKKTFNVYCFNPYSPGRTAMFFHYLYNIVSFGGILVFLFMWTNQHFKSDSKTIATVPIVSYGHLAKSRNNCGMPYAHIIFQDKEKELIFPCGTEIEKYRSVYVEIKKGVFGFDVITNKTLIEGQW